MSWRRRGIPVVVVALTLAASACQSTGVTPTAESDVPSVRPSESVAAPEPKPTAERPAGPSRKALQRQLGEALRKAVEAQDFDDVVGISGIPHVDAAVIQLDEKGRPVVAADALLSKEYPDAVVPTVDDNFAATDVRWRHWTGPEWGSGSEADVVDGREDAKLDFTSPYPASIVKLLVGFGILRLVDQGEIDLDDSYTYRPTHSTGICGAGGVTRKIRSWFDQMITVSDNTSTCALITVLQKHDGIDAVNKTFEDLGLSTLFIEGTEQGTGRDWRGISMTALDTARLLLMVNGSPGTLWKAPDGKPVTADVLSEPSRKFFQEELSEQGINQMISTVNWCGRDYPAAGIPHRVASRWISTDGTVTVGARNYEQDVRPCNAEAEVTFAHKTGLVPDAGGDAGIVKSLPGKAKRNYIVVVFTNMGMRVHDADRPSDPAGVFHVPVTQKFSQLGAAIDKLMIESTRRAG